MSPGAKVVEPFFHFELKPEPEKSQVKRLFSSTTILFLIPLPLAEASNIILYMPLKIGNLRKNLITIEF